MGADDDVIDLRGAAKNGNGDIFDQMIVVFIKKFSISEFSEHGRTEAS